MDSLKHKRIILGVTGSIAAIKSPAIARELNGLGASVYCVLTESAEQFVTRAEMAEATGEAVIASIFAQPGTAVRQQAGTPAPHKEQTWHVHLARSADAMLIAPCSASAIGMLRAGIYDNAVLLAAASLPKGTPLVLAPAMDEDMWLQPAVQENLAWLKSHGVLVIEPVVGALASGLTGMGRMPEPKEIVREFQDVMARSPRLPREGRETLPLQNMRVLITGGPTYEPIDAVRFIGNRSSGKMGAALARQAKKMGAEVTLVLGPAIPFPLLETEGVTVVSVETAEEMKQAVLKELPRVDIVIMSAAVADFMPEAQADKKLKKRDIADQFGRATLRLKRTPDILAAIGRLKRAGQIVVGFALEKGKGSEQYALGKMKEKKLDMIVLNDIAEEGAGFGYDTNKITIFTNDGNRESLPLMSKEACATVILQTVATRISRERSVESGELQFHHTKAKP